MPDFRTRAQWGAEFDVSRVPIIKTPVVDIFIHHTAGRWTNDPNDDMLAIERYDEWKFGKPSYDWVIHPSGVILEGMTIHLSPDTYGRNRDSLSICFMGNFDNEQPTPAAMLAARWLIANLVHFKLVVPAFRILGHKDTYPTACPGANLYPRIQELAVPLIPVPAPIVPIEEELMNTTKLDDGRVLLTIIGTDSKVYYSILDPNPDKPVDWSPWTPVRDGRVRNPASA